ncbi:MAG: hypothetical protein AVDCRST_MAG39-2472, partial [uncultured Sphingomonadaceae bacterium]
VPVHPHHRHRPHRHQPVRRRPDVDAVRRQRHRACRAGYRGRAQRSRL